MGCDVGDANDGLGSLKICGGKEPGRPCQKVAGARVLRSEDLLQGGRELYIAHGGKLYRLLKTKNDKLILQR
jgi:hemin uptake protein HemP